MTEESAVVAGDVPKVRPARFDPAADVPRYWFGGNAGLSHSVNGLNLLFPAGERFFVRSVRAYLGQIDDPELLARVRGFIGQEAQHGRAHEAAFKVLERQGYEVRSFLGWYEWLGYDVIEPLAPPILRLAVTVALEHYTAVMAENALSRDLMEAAHPALRDLLRWHAAEEIEHKSVAFDVLRAVDDRYAVRLAGLALGTFALLMFWTVGTRHLVRQDPWLSRSRLRQDRRDAQAMGANQDFWRIGVVSYLRRGFHPDQIDNRRLADVWLAAFRPEVSGG
jgi:predicted metal-dependent hydrolase